MTATRRGSVTRRGGKLRWVIRGIYEGEQVGEILWRTDHEIRKEIKERYPHSPPVATEVDPTPPPRRPEASKTKAKKTKPPAKPKPPAPPATKPKPTKPKRKSGVAKILEQTERELQKTTAEIEELEAKLESLRARQDKLRQAAQQLGEIDAL